MPVVPTRVRNAANVGAKALLKRAVIRVHALGHVHAVYVKSKSDRLARAPRVYFGYETR